VAWAASASWDSVLRALSELLLVIRPIASEPASSAVMTAIAQASSEMR